MPGEMNTSENTSPSEIEAREYIENHRIVDLLNNMTSELVYTTPGIHCCN